jgi:hypothetical protein
MARRQYQWDIVEVFMIKNYKEIYVWVIDCEGSFCDYYQLFDRFIDLDEDSIYDCIQQFAVGHDYVLKCFYFYKEQDARACLDSLLIMQNLTK